MLRYVKGAGLIPYAGDMVGCHEMRLIRSNFPDEVWSRLKAWAKDQALANKPRTLEECTAQVESVAKDITGAERSLRPDVVAFYAAETLEMIARFQNEPGDDPVQVPAT